MNNRALFRTGVIGAVVAALCCATPILGIALGAIGLSALATKVDYVLIPVLVASLGLVGIGLYRRKVSTPAVIDCCETDKNTGKFKS
ncbi:mercury resistance system transport protein MerF [Sphingobium scionense]|uniref:Mercuric ion transport protein n=1 Tax=Sphingobium scionense TaxID=1404341 RepID=A0A7W6LUD2_9SPHN|nr:mercury resistance system transport protein MerF [Sphingobium scionense]MBB4150661.1 mercuric ion transport protein [Sphingobium scionense]